jgi:hypothetical protein
MTEKTMEGQSLRQNRPIKAYLQDAEDVRWDYLGREKHVIIHALVQFVFCTRKYK